MKTLKEGKTTINIGLSVLIWFLVFQSPLESVWGPFSYIDEVTALIGAVMGLYDIFVVRKGRPSKEQLWMGILLLLFSVTGLLGNIIYQYQPLKCVIIDLYTNLKFFFAIGTGYYLFASADWEEIKKTVQWNAQTITLILFALFLIDRIFCIWPEEMRYGIRSARLFYFHCTYLAGAACFLLVLLTVSYDKKNIPFLAADVLLMMFTLRSKAIASGAIFVAVFVFMILMKQRIKLWHMIAAASACVVGAWPKIYNYYVAGVGITTRSILHSVSMQIAEDYFPIGTGFGTYASAESVEVFSPVYELYNFEYICRHQSAWRHFLSDTFWPIIVGQTGAIGMIIYVFCLACLLSKCWKLQYVSVHSYVAVLFSWAYMMISSTSEPIFHNMIAIPLAVVMGIAFCAMEKNKFPEL